MPAISRQHPFGDSADRSFAQARETSGGDPRGRSPPQSSAPLLQAVHRHMEALLAERLDGSSLQTVLLQLIDADQARKRGGGPMAFLPLFTAQLVGGAAEVAIPAAAAWNLLHLAACLFDQLEDAYSPWPASCCSPEQTLGGLDLASAMNAATALLFLAPLALHTRPQSSGVDQRRSFTRRWTLQLTDGLHNTWLRMCTGQHRDLTEMANPRFTPNDYWQVVGAKSGSCFAWAGQAGAVLGGGAAPQVAACARYGYNLTKPMSELLPSRWELKRPAIWVVCVTSIALLFLILGATHLVASQSYTGLDWSMIDGKIYAVEAGSPAAAAGLQPGDTIVSIDSQPLARGLARYTQAAPGQTINLHVLREGQIHFFSLVAGSLTPSRLLRRLEPLFIALGFALCGFIVWAYKPYDRQTILFLAFNHLEAAALTLGLLSSLGHRSGALGFPVALYFLSPALIHFHLVFPRAKPFAGRRLMLMALYSVASVGAAVWIGSYGRGASANAYVFTRLGMRFYFAAAVVISIGLLLYTYRESLPADQRRIRLVVFSPVLAFAPLVGLAILPEALTGVPLVAYELTFPFLLVIPLAYAYAIRRYRLMALDRFLNRSLVYLMLTLLLAGFYLLLSAMLSRLGLARFLREPLAVTLVALAVAVTFHPLRDRLQRWADRLFYGGWYDYRAVVHGTGQALVAASEPAALARALLDGLTVAMKLRCACLLLAEGSGSQFSACVPAGEGCPLLAGQPLTLPRQGALARRLAEEVGLVYGIQLRRALEGEPLARVEEALLACPHGRLWVPLRREGRLLAALLLGPKPGEEPFGAEDRAILEALARETAVVMENLALLSQVEQRAREVDRLHGELLAAREAERKRVARELHDGVIQELIAAYRGLRTRPHLDPEAAEAKVAETEAKLRELMDEVRRICADLRPAVLDVLGLAEAVRSHAEVFGLHTGIAVRVTVVGDAEARLPEAVELCLFRVLQEALRNVEQHASASAVEVVLEMPAHFESSPPRKVSLAVRDDGCGFAVPHRLGLLLDQGHFGLVGSRERLALVGGTLEVSSGPGRGTELVAQVPLEGR